MNKMQTTQNILEIRSRNEQELKRNPSLNKTQRYRIIANDFGICEWSARWICQGKSFPKVGGFIEKSDLYKNNKISASIDDIKQKFSAGYSPQYIANLYGVSNSTIKRILNGQTFTAQKKSDTFIKTINNCTPIQYLLVKATSQTGKDTKQISTMYNLPESQVEDILNFQS